jgi:hypothetical protein
MDFSQGLTGLVPKVNTTALLQGIMVFLIIVIALGCVGYYLWYTFKKKKYNQYRIIIWEKDSTGNTQEDYDRAGVFLDKKTGFKLLFLEKRKIGLNPNNIPYVTAKDKKGKLVKTVYLRKIGISNYVFCHVKLAEDGMMFTVGEEDANWLEQEMEKIRRTFGTESMWSKIAPYLMFVISMMLLMIVLISLFNKFGVIKDASDNMVKVSEKQLEITGLLFNMSKNPNLNSAVPIIVSGTNSVIGGQNG